MKKSNFHEISSILHYITVKFSKLWLEASKSSDTDHWSYLPYPSLERWIPPQQSLLLILWGRRWMLLWISFLTPRNQKCMIHLLHRMYWRRALRRNLFHLRQVRIMKMTLKMILMKKVSWLNQVINIEGKVWNGLTIWLDVEQRNEKSYESACYTDLLKFFCISAQKSLEILSWLKNLMRAAPCVWANQCEVQQFLTVHYSDV